MDREQDRPCAHSEKVEGLGVHEEVGQQSQGAKAYSQEGQQSPAGGFQKKLAMRVLRLKEKYPTAKVELWCEDEHRLGLKPIIRKVWSPIGERPHVLVHQRYEWTYL